MALNEFPRPPFRFESEHPDKQLLEYLKESMPWYLGDEARSHVAELNPDSELNKQRELVTSLWTAVLKDALKGLKRHDPRECGSKKGTIQFESFFDEHSLGTERLSEVLKAFREFESLMYGAQPHRYRDHVAHTLRVWIIGHGLLKHCFKRRLHADRLFDDGIRCREWECIWAMTALCHDIGYPLTAIEKINDRTRQALEGQGLHHVGDLRYGFSPWIQPLQETLLQLMASKVVRAPSGLRRRGKTYVTHLQNKYYMKFLNSLDRLEHGVVSALIVGRSLVYFLESDLCHDPFDPLSKEDARQFLIRREILRAIAAHTCPEIYHLSFRTLAFLLFIVDELQCWGRPTFEQLMEGIQPHHDDEVTLKEFDADSIDIEVRAGGEWEHRRGAAERQLNGIHKRLRLAVGTPMLSALHLRYEVKTEDEKGCFIELEDGRIKEGKL